MRTFFGNLPRSASLKVGIIAALILGLLIPVSMIQGVIWDRDATSNLSRTDIMQSWGGEQTIAGPILIVPYEVVSVTQYGERVVDEGRAYVLPDKLELDASLAPDIRYRGLHKVPVYTADIRLSGTFNLPISGELDIETAYLDWQHATVALGISDARAVTSAPVLSMGGVKSKFESAAVQIAALPPQIIAPVGGALTKRSDDGPVEFEIALNINGTKSLKVLPLGDTSTISMNSSWPSPSFVGSYLPQSREISDGGFTAEWRISSIGRQLPSRWIEGSLQVPALSNLAFGVDLFVPVGLYQKTLRTTKYAILFIGLTFVAYFLFEIVAGLHLHPLQYLMVGLANTLFYLLLLSLAEHMGFGWAYLLSSLGSSGLIVGYSRAVLGDRRRAMTISGVLFCLYGFLYMTVQAENYAMLSGAVGLWIALSIVMYLTRRVNWYGDATTATDKVIDH